MRLVSTADWHLRNCDSYGSVDSLNVNEFLMRRVQAAREIISVASKKDHCLAIIGDFVDDVLMDGVTLYYSSMLIKMMSEINNPVLILEGNHGYDGKQGEYSSIKHWSHLAGKNIRIVTKPEIITIKNVEFHCIPAISDVDKLFYNIVKEFLSQTSNSNNKKILLFHGPIIDARFDNNAPTKNGVKQKYISWVSKIYDHVICGDFHRHQFVRDNVWYTGSPIQTSLKDKMQKKGYQIVNLETDNVKFVEIKNSPRFIEADWIVGDSISPILKRPEDYEASLNNSVVIIRLAQPLNSKAEIDFVVKNLLAHGAMKVFVDRKTLSERKKRTSINVDMSLEQIIGAYAEHKRNNLPSRKRRVVENGLRYLR
jgi:DNA repair exonuclease SbcCD nuclease subunit